MNMKSCKSGAVRFLSLLLALAMVCSLVPPMHVHAAEASLKITNAEGEETDTFVVGEPIYVTASSTISGDWVGFYDLNYASTSAFWYYTSDAEHENGGTYNVYDGEPNNGWEGWMMEPGEGRYEVRLVEAGLKQTINIVAPEDPTYSSLTVENATVTAGESIMVEATSYKNGSWVALYSGTKSASDSFGSGYLSYLYVTGHNGIYMDFPVYTAGDYTVVLFADSGYTVDKVVNVTVKEAEETKVILSTDKTEYAYGDAIMVTVDSSAYNAAAKDWVALYKRGEIPGDPTSLFYYYPAESGATYNLLNGEPQRQDEFIAGEYTVYLLANDGYTPITSIDIVITTEIDDSKTVKVDPTCETDGYIIYTYTDGTTKKVTAAEDESLKALGHEWSDWAYDGVDKKTHTKTCANADHPVTEDCAFDEGVVTKEATETENGIKTYTCSGCGGTYTEEISQKEIDRTETIKEATCEEEGTLRTYYTDGSYIDTVIPKLGHDYPETWTFDAENKKHVKVCGNDETHVQSEDCSFKLSAVTTTTVTFTCSVCGGSYDKPIFYTDKTEYKWGEPILVSTYHSRDNSWVGLYKRGEPTNGSVVSIYWYYTGPNLGEPVNILTTDGTNGRLGEFVAGEYTVVLYKDSGYTAYATVDIVITTEIDESKTVRVEPTCDKDGSVTYYNTDGTVARTEVLPKLGHDYDEAWIYDAATHKHYHVCKNDASHHTEHIDCSFDDGVVTKEPEGDVAGEKTYTCSVCGGTYIEQYFDKVETGREVIVPATCETDGTERVYYSDGTYLDVVITKLGHNYGDWEFDEETHTHTQTCANDTNKDHVITENCSGKLDKVQGTTAYYTCSVCGGTYTVSILSTDKTEYKYGEPIMVTSVSQGDGRDWVGIYKKGESYNPDTGGAFSIYWYYIPSGSFTAQINVPANDLNGRSGEFVSGEYTIAMFADDTYTHITEIDIVITADVVKTETVEPTCEKDGATITYYSDGTTKTETIPATGHSYGELWHFDAETHQHYHICQNDSTHTSDWTACEFDEGVSILEPEGDIPGVMEYTCEVCRGKYTETYFNKTVVSEEVVTPATCEAEGVYRYTYEDGTYLDVAIPKLGHRYGEWVYDDSIQSHVRTCANDEKHTETVACSFGEGVVSNGKVTYTCSVCGGEHVTSILITDKDEYTMQDDIMVTAYTDLADAWVGLYGINDEPGTHAGSVVSYYWFYVNKEGNTSGTAENMLDHYNTDRGEGLVPGEYKLILFGDGGYDKIIAYKNITIVDDGTETVYEVKLNGTSYENGALVKYQYGDSVELVVNVDGRVGQAWVGVYTNKVSTDTQFSAGTPSAYWEYLVNVNGKTINLGDKIDLEPGDYSVVIFADGGYTRPMIAVNFSIEKEASNVQVIKEPTCTDYGVSFVTYEDGTTTYLPIEPLGHSFETGEWAHDENERTHTRTCDRCSEIVTYACYFSKVEIIKEATENSDGLKRFTCEVCGGSYTEAYELNTEKSTDVSRLYGDTRFETAFGIAEALKKNLGVEKFDTIILASGSSFADALSGAYLANLKNAPILLCFDEEYDAKTVAYVQENLASGGTVYILGGEKAVSGSVDAALKAAGISNIKRLAGENRFETNLQILKEAGVSGGEVLVCTGTNFADVLSASAVNKPILLVYNDLYASQQDFLKSLSVSQFYIIGGKSAVSYDIESELKAYTNTTMRLGGSTRYETSVLIAERFFDDHDTAVLTYGMNFPDGLCGGLLANSMNAPVILTQTGSFSAAAENYAAKHQIKSGIVLGGQGLISDGTVKSIFQMTSDNSITEVYFQ